MKDKWTEEEVKKLIDDLDLQYDKNNSTDWVGFCSAEQLFKILQQPLKPLLIEPKRLPRKLKKKIGNGKKRYKYKVFWNSEK